jgi:hypothetical protein
MQQDYGRRARKRNSRVDPNEPGNCGKALLRSANAELRRAYFALRWVERTVGKVDNGLPYDLSDEAGVASMSVRQLSGVGSHRAYEAAKKAQRSDERRPSYARLTPSYEGHTSPQSRVIGVPGKSMACHTKPPSLRGGEVWAGVDSNH